MGSGERQITPTHHHLTRHQHFKIRFHLPIYLGCCTHDLVSMWGHGALQPRPGVHVGSWGVAAMTWHPYGVMGHCSHGLASMWGHRVMQPRTGVHVESGNNLQNSFSPSTCGPGDRIQVFRLVGKYLCYLMFGLLSWPGGQPDSGLGVSHSKLPIQKNKHSQDANFHFY